MVLTISGTGRHSDRRLTAGRAIAPPIGEKGEDAPGGVTSRRRRRAANCLG
jgi:hypothetical protein